MPFFGIVPVFLETPYIKLTYEANAPDRGFMNGLFADASRYEHVSIPDGMDPRVATVIKDPETKALTVVVSGTKLAEETSKAWDALRTERSARLAAIDYRFLSDYPMSDAEREAWRVYRQALRDLPDQTTDPFHPVWPEMPSA